MSINVYMILWILLAHYLSDFIFQSHTMAINKSKSLKWLSLHCLVYTAGLTIVMPIGAVAFAVVNGLAHFVIDFFTSRWSSALYAKKDYHNFFCVIGFDQLLHISILMITYLLYFGD